MEENVALNKKHQSKFAKKIKKAKARAASATLTNFVQAPVDNKPDKLDERGTVYLGHIPHGFYENEMLAYFKQFGKVCNVRLCRSKSTGQSKGYAFIEFRNAEVAKIAAETMNNYIMFNRRLVAKYIPYDKAYRHLNRTKSWSLTNYPKKGLREKVNQQRNANLDEASHLKSCKRLVGNLNKTLRKLHDAGIKYSLKPEDPDNILPKLRQTNNKQH